MLSEEAGFYSIFIRTILGVHIYSYSHSTAARLTSPVWRSKCSALDCTLLAMGWWVLPAPNTARGSQPNFLTAGGTSICSGVRLLLKSTIHRAWCFMWVYEVARLWTFFFFFFQSTFRKKKKKEEVKEVQKKGNEANSPH